MTGSGRPVGLTALLILMTAAVAPAAAAQDALSTIDSCTARLNTDLDIGYERIAARCPELVRRRDDSGWSAWLPRDWKRPGNDLSAGSLRELRILVARELATQATARTPRVEQLRGVLAGLDYRGHDGNGWWARTKAWLRDVFERREETVADGWLTRLVAQIGLSQALIELVSYAAVALVVLLAGLVVLNELRSSGVFARRGSQAAHPAFSATSRRDGLTWNDIE